MCVLRVTGRGFDPVSYLRTSAITACAVHVRGTPRFRSKPEGPLHEVSSFTADVSAAPWTDLAAQTMDAETFLARHGGELQALASMPEVDDVRLDFPVEQRRVAVQCCFFPPSLLAAAGRLGLGIELSVYPAGDGRGAEEPS